MLETTEIMSQDYVRRNGLLAWQIDTKRFQMKDFTYS